MIWSIELHFVDSFVNTRFPRKSRQNIFKTPDSFLMLLPVSPQYTQAATFRFSPGRLLLPVVDFLYSVYLVVPGFFFLTWCLWELSTLLYIFTGYSFLNCLIAIHCINTAYLFSLSPMNTRLSCSQFLNILNNVTVKILVNVIFCR